MKNTDKVAIIGGGPAGLTAGYELLKQVKCDVKIFEESDQVGGISKTVRYNNNRIDIGGHRFFSKNDKIMDWWTSILPLQGSPSLDHVLLNEEQNHKYETGGPDPERSDRVMLVRRRVSRIFYLKKFFDYPISVRLETFTNMGLSRTLKAGLGYISSAVRKRKENTLEDFYINRFGKPLYQMFFENYTEKVWGVHPSKLGADWGSQRVKGLSLTTVLKDMITKSFRKKNDDVEQKNTETSLIEQFIYPKFGPGQLWEIVADETEKNGGIVRLNSRVKTINVQDNKAVSVETVENGATVTIPCDYLISSMPLKDLIAALRGTEIPEEVKETAEKLPYRDFVTVGLLVDKMLISNKTKLKTWKNIVPDTWIYIQEPDIKIGRLQIFNNWSPYMVGDFENKVWIGLEYFCSEGDDLWQADDKSFIRSAIDELHKTGIIDKKDVCDSVRIKVKKAYPAYYGSYYKLNKIIEFLNGIENLYCIGRNGQHRYNNMDHSMLTAMEAVDCITGKKNDKSGIWNVNTEKEYHEKK